MLTWRQPVVRRTSSIEPQILILCHQCPAGTGAQPYVASRCWRLSYSKRKCRVVNTAPRVFR
jgi:hypothetical protein